MAEENKGTTQRKPQIIWTDYFRLGKILVSENDEKEEELWSHEQFLFKELDEEGVYKLYSTPQKEVIAHNIILENHKHPEVGKI